MEEKTLINNRKLYELVRYYGLASPSEVHLQISEH